MLNEMRLGKISDDTVQTFKALSRPLTFDDDLDVTELFVAKALPRIQGRLCANALQVPYSARGRQI